MLLTIKSNIRLVETVRLEMTWIRIRTEHQSHSQTHRLTANCLKILNMVTRSTVTHGDTICRTSRTTWKIIPDDTVCLSRKPLNTLG